MEVKEAGTPNSCKGNIQVYLCLLNLLTLYETFDQYNILTFWHYFKFELTPIVNLFTEENLDERYNVSSVAILEWFLPLYLKYCKVRFVQNGKCCLKGH